MPIKSCTQVESAEPLNLASETPTVFHGRELPAGLRDGLVGHALWLRKEAARRGYAWRQQQRARQLSSLRAACVPPGGNVGEALRYAPSGAGVLVESLRELATRGKRTSTGGTGSGEGAGARVAMRSVLEDHETAVLELERQVCEVECLVKHMKPLEQLVMQLQDTTFQTRDMSRTVAELGMKLETRVERQVSVMDMLETRVQETQKVVADLGQQFHRVGGRPRAACSRNCKVFSG